MKYIAVLFILLACIYSLSYARYSWNVKNKLAAIGMALLVMVSVVLPVMMMFFR